MSVSKQLILVQLTGNTNKVTSVTTDLPNGITANKKELTYTTTPKILCTRDVISLPIAMFLLQVKLSLFSFTFIFQNIHIPLNLLSFI